MKKTEKKQALSEILSVDESGKLVGADKLFKPLQSRRKSVIGNWLLLSFFLFVIVSITGISLLLTFHETAQITLEWISFGLLCFTLILPLLFFFAVLRILL